VRQAEADLERNEAQLRYAQSEYERVRELHGQNLASEKEFNAAQYELELARANTKAARLALEKAKQNLTYATILAPVSGTVIERNVDVGQTVAASFSAPQLFLIANDLAQMQILASVDESDIGVIKDGQLARFTVQAYPDEVFTGTVRQVRLQSTTEENVVNYTVVVDVANDDGRLLPGMTATVDFVTDQANDVLMVANAALRFRPTEEMMAEVRARRQRASGDGPETMRGNNHNERPANAALLYYLDADGKLAATRVRTGLSDGQKTVIEGNDIQAGMEMIAGVGQTTQTNTTNPFQSQQRQGPPRPPGVF
jgi:HlyD family secretion protein